MWSDAPGLFEMMMKFFATYEDIVKTYSKPFEEACRDFLGDIFLHYEACALKRICTVCLSQCGGKCCSKKEQNKFSTIIKEEVKNERDSDEQTELVVKYSNEYIIQENGDVGGENSSWNTFDDQNKQQAHSSYLTDSDIVVSSYDTSVGTSNGPNSYKEINVQDCSDVQVMKVEAISDFPIYPISEHVSAETDCGNGAIMAKFDEQVKPSNIAFDLPEPSQKLPHFPTKIIHSLGSGLKRNPTKRCRLCYRERRARKETRFWCGACPTKPGLCLEPCFQLWHQEIDRGNHDYDNYTRQNLKFSISDTIDIS